MTTWLTLKQVGGFTNSRGETCRQIRQDRRPTCKQLRHRRQRGTKPIGRRAIGILSILQAQTAGECFSKSQDRFQLPGEKPPANRRWGVNSTSTHKTRTELHSMIALHHANTRGSSSRIAHLCVSKTKVIHVSCLVLGRT